MADLEHWYAMGRRACPPSSSHSEAMDLAKKLGSETEVSRCLGHLSDVVVKTYFRFLSEREVADEVVELDKKQT